jgi:hypothetical protein
MKLLRLFALMSCVCAFALSAFASEVSFVGGTRGCFGAGCALGTFAANSSGGGLSFLGSTFDAETLGGFLALGGNPAPTSAAANFNNLGSFSLDTLAVETFAGQMFTLFVDFTQPMGTSPNPGTYTAVLRGAVNQTPNAGGVTIDFDNTPHIFTFTSSLPSGGPGSFTLQVNDLSLNAGSRNADVSGDILARAAATPEPGTMAMIGLGLTAGFSAVRRFRAKRIDS